MASRQFVTDDDTRLNGLTICKSFLSGAWKDADLEDFCMERIRGGLSNMLYLCSLSNKVKVRDDEERRVLLRLYGQLVRENPESILTDSVIFALLAEKRMGPKLFGVFVGGRVEEYVPSRVLRTSELADVEISTAIARTMARLHKIKMPIVKEPRWLFDTIARDILAKVKSPVVFCHNDLQEAIGGCTVYDSTLNVMTENILLRTLEQSDTNIEFWEILPIDFGYAEYNFRGFDIANHFCEWCYNYTLAVPPYFSASIDDYPTYDQQLLFIRAYLDEYTEGEEEEQKEEERGNSVADRDSGCEIPASVNEEMMLFEVNSFIIASHFLWGLWAILQSHVAAADIQFEFLDYSAARFDAYFKHKHQLLERYPWLATGNQSNDVTDNDIAFS